jgi:hypothetical protein
MIDRYVLLEAIHDEFGKLRLEAWYDGNRINPLDLTDRTFTIVNIYLDGSISLKEVLNEADTSL